MLRFAVLGPMLVTYDEEPIDLPTAMLRRLVAILLCQPGQPLPIDLLLETLWEGQPPPSARKTLQIMCIGCGVRSVSAGCCAARPATGCRWQSTEVGLDPFRRSVFAKPVRPQSGRTYPMPSRLYGKALQLWRGNAFADIIGNGHVTSHARQLDEFRLHALERVRRHRAAPRPPMPRSSAGSLQQAVANPYLEKLREYLLLALYRSGRQAEALAEYRQLHRQLVDELGVEPGPELRQLHDRCCAAIPS